MLQKYVGRRKKQGIIFLLLLSGAGLDKMCAGSLIENRLEHHFLHHFPISSHHRFKSDSFWRRATVSGIVSPPLFPIAPGGFLLLSLRLRYTFPFKDVGVVWISLVRCLYLANNSDNYDNDNFIVVLIFRHRWRLASTTSMTSPKQARFKDSTPPR